VQGALQVKEKVPDGVFIFLTPPDLDELRERLCGRGTDSLDTINERMAKAREEIKLMSEYDYAVVNDEVHLAVERVKKIVEAEHFRVDRVIGRYHEMLDVVKQTLN
jgi:guanylate kinase